VIGFASASEYRPYRINAAAEAYYTGTEGRDYIVLPLDGPRAAGVAAHEYAHMALHSAGLALPRWLAEGVAEVFSTLHIDEGGGLIGSDRPEFSQLLRRAAWMPWSGVLHAERGDQPGLFYAQSWALTDMLAFSPEYGSKLRALAGAVSAMPPENAFASVYGRTIDSVDADLHAWIGRRRAGPALRIAGVAADAEAVEVSEITPLRARVLLATLLLDGGETARAEALFRDLVREAPEIGDVEAALGVIALTRGEREDGRERFARAVRLGVSDDALCFRFAALAQRAGLSDADIRPALERAVAIRPEFDDARYNLALIEKNTGNAQAALDHLRTMREPGPPRAFDYWLARFDALNSLERHEEAEAAAKTAAAHATTDAEKARAAESAWIARTEVAVRLAPDAQGQPRMVTTRVPRRGADFNPFVEALDEVRTVEGALREVECGGPGVRIVVESAAGRQTLAIPDPARVQMRNAPPEFTCGAQAGEAVVVTYAARRMETAEGVVRGIEFRR
jgi:tetratricopeptide (TPR) repeat protein